MLIHYEQFNAAGDSAMVVDVVEANRAAILCTYERWDDLDGVLAQQVVFIFEDDPEDVNLADYFQELTDYDVWVRIPVQTDHGFRRKLTTDSAAN